jgi:hypothetical protein
MAAFNFRPIVEHDLPEVAAFLYRQQEITSREDSTQARPSNDDLRWLLSNPHRSDGASLGDTIRDPEGRIMGMIVAVPRMYRLGPLRRRGLAAGHFFIDASARMQGFFMLKRFLASQGFDFVYANSCNGQSGPLWAKCGALMVPESEVEYLLPFRLGPLAEEVAIRKAWHPAVARALTAAGPLATLVAGPRLPKNRFKVEPTKDIERLAEVAERNQNPAFLQPERSAPYLQWAYGSLLESTEFKESGSAIYRFSSSSGHEGWFSLIFARRGHRDQIRAARLKDVVWPFEHMAFTDVIPAIAEAARDRTDLLSIRGRVGLALEDRVLGMRRRTLLAPEGYVLGRNPPTAEIAKVADFPFADRY